VNKSETISHALKEFNLSNKVIALTIENESAMLTCGCLLAEELENEFNNIEFSHYHMTINNKNQSMVRLCDELHALCDLKRIKYLKAKLNIEVRWNSTFYMLQKFKNIELALNLLSVNNNSIAELLPNHDDQ
ncbi:17331_t:CDS:2, partial [Cetraspora pellucida]